MKDKLITIDFNEYKKMYDSIEKLESKFNEIIKNKENDLNKELTKKYEQRYEKYKFSLNKIRDRELCELINIIVNNERFEFDISFAHTSRTMLCYSEYKSEYIKLINHISNERKTLLEDMQEIRNNWLIKILLKFNFIKLKGI